MFDIFWKTLARLLICNTWLVNILIHNAQKKPYYHIEGYMKRWWLMPKCLIGVDEYGHPFPYSWMPFCIRLHHILRPDNERHLHDHPCDFRVIILRGYYEEQDISGQGHRHDTGSTFAHRAEHFHKIVTMPVAGVWTLFIMCRKRNRWGFLVGGRKVYWRHYLENKDKYNDA